MIVKSKQQSIDESQVLKPGWKPKTPDALRATMPKHEEVLSTEEQATKAPIEESNLDDKIANKGTNEDCSTFWEEKTTALEEPGTAVLTDEKPESEVKYGDSDLFFNVFNAIPVTAMSSELFAEAKNGVVCVSPSNPFYTERNIVLMIKWARKTFKNFAVYLPDGVCHNSWMSVGYTRDEARQKAQKKDNQMKNRIISALKSLGYSDRDMLKHFRYHSEFTSDKRWSDEYNRANAYIRRLALIDADFSSALNRAAESFQLSNNDKSLSYEDLYQLHHYALEGLILELLLAINPRFFLHAPNVCIYHRMDFNLNDIFKHYGFHYKCALVVLEITPLAHFTRRIVDGLECSVYAKNLNKQMLLTNHYLENKHRIANDCTGKSLGQLSNEISSIPLHDFVAAENNDNVVLEMGKQLVFEEKAGDTTYLSVKKPLYDLEDRLIGIIGISIDISKQKMLQSALEQAIARATQYGVALQNAIEQKDRYHTVLNHEVRVPIINTKAVVSITLDEARHLKKSDLIERLHLISGAMNKMSHVSQNAYALAQDKTTLRLAKVNLRKLLEAEFKLAKYGDTRNNKMTLKFEGENFETYCDGLSIAQVMSNLIDNALKFTENGKVDIKLIHRSDQYSKVFIFQVTDTGIGMTQTLNKNFDMTHSDIRALANKGLGVGLMLCHRIIAAHGGTLTTYDANGGGTVAKFVIKDNDVDFTVFYQNKISDYCLKHLHRKIKILLIDDDILAHKILEVTLNKNHFDFKGASGGEEAIRYLKDKSNVVDVILLDAFMPEMHGQEFITRIGRDPALAHYIKRTIIQTGNVQGGFNNLPLLEKPFEYDFMIQAIVAVLDRTRVSADEEKGYAAYYTGDVAPDEDESNDDNSDGENSCDSGDDSVDDTDESWDNDGDDADDTNDD